MAADLPEREHPDRVRWNRRYREREERDRHRRPSRWLTAHRRLLDQLPKGSALDLACGTGRNSLYLARLGFEVEAVDISDVAVRRLGDLAARRKLPIRARVMNLETAGLPRGRYRVIVNINYLERKLFPAIQAALRPGGLLFFVSFLKGPSAPLRGKINPAYLLDPGELRRAFAGLEILEYREGLAEAPAPPGKPESAFLLARKNT